MLWLVIIVVYLALALVATYMVHQKPRRPIRDVPDWGRVEEVRIPATDGTLEAWRVWPAGPSRGTVVLAHGWSRNRDRMTARARVFGEMGFVTVMASVRDHGGSTKRRWMNAARFGEDIGSVLDWVGEPVILYGHSAGAGGAVLAAAARPDRIRLLFLEGCYLYTRTALLRLYWDFHPLFAILFGPGILLWMEILYKGRVRETSPALVARRLTMPVMIIHADEDEKFPVAWAPRLAEAFASDHVEVFVAHGQTHSTAPDDPGYGPAVNSFVEQNRDRK